MKTKTLNVNCTCMATYNSSIEVPADLSLKDAIEYAKEHIDRINVTELEYVCDSDSVNEESCSFDEDEVLDYKDKEIKPIATVDELIKAIEDNPDLDWYISKNTDDPTENYLDFKGSSPEGEDISFAVYFDATKLPCEQIQEIIDELDSCYECFDVEEHVTLHIEAKNNGIAGIPDVETLVEDAKEIDEIFKNLSEFVNDLPKQDVVFKAVDIDYDIDEDDDCDELELPKEIELEPVDFDNIKEYCENGYEEIIDLVSDEAEWYVKSCRVIQVINGNTTTEV